jgi:hypothetical protein
MTLYFGMNGGHLTFFLGIYYCILKPGMSSNTGYMIKGRFNTFGFWLMLGSTAVFVLLLVYMVFQMIFHTSGEALNSAIANCIIFSIAIVIFGAQLWRDAKGIMIDTIEKKMTVKNRITQRSKQYGFKDFDGYAVMNQFAGYTSFKVIYLIRNKVAVVKMTSFIYSNLAEMQEALKPIKFLGNLRSGIFTSMDILLGNEILD